MNYLHLILVAAALTHPANARLGPNAGHRAVRKDLATWTIGPFVRIDSVNPIITPRTASTFECPMRKTAVAWEHDNTFNPAAVERNGRLYVLYRAEDNSGQGIGGHTSRIGLAETRDGLRYTRLLQPVLYPAEDNQKQYDWPGGCEDPRIVETPGGYVLTYTAWNRKTPRLCVATSKDLVHWRKRGPAFAKAKGGKFLELATKSGAIVTQKQGDHFRAVKLHGQYWMYWGDGPVCLASSNNLIDWDPIAGADGKPLPILSARPGKFDSALPEAGPPAVLTPEGIVLIYNGKNAEEHGDPDISPGAYSAGQALFSSEEPTKVLQRLDKPFFKPERAFEVTGQYRSGTVFVEGLASFHKHLWLFYGAADSKVAVATYPKF
jgi:predicted GH43/DUF377 family glycosyl hydrolase